MSRKKDNLIKQTRELFYEKFSQTPEVISISPGRINIIGEHVDYNGGLAMPVAIDKYICVAISKNNKKKINVFSMNLNEMLSIDLNKIIPSKLWHKYVLGSILEGLKDKNLEYGINIIINSTLPIGKGLSSSAALELSIMNAVLKIFNIKLNDNEIIKRCQLVDHQHIGIKSGRLDQSACLLSKQEYIFIIDFQDLSVEYIPIDLAGVSWILVDSMIKRELATSKYNKRVKECEEAFQKLSIKIKGLENFRDINQDDYSIVESLDSNLKHRVQHIIQENQRVLNMKDAIINNNIENIGELLSESHQSLKKYYQVSCDEIDYLIKSSEDLDYWYGGRIMGGGFGGNTLNLIKKGYENEYVDIISSSYKKKFNINCSLHLIDFVDGAEIIDNISVD